jgi:hypothetical protein
MSNDDLLSLAGAAQTISNAAQGFLHMHLFISIVAGLALVANKRNSKNQKRRFVAPPEIWPNGFSPKGGKDTDHKTREEKKIIYPRGSEIRCPGRATVPPRLAV